MKKPGLDPEIFEQQFPHQERYYDTGKAVTPWYEIIKEGVPSRHAAAYARGGSVVHKALAAANKTSKGGR